MPIYPRGGVCKSFRQESTSTQERENSLRILSTIHCHGQSSDPAACVTCARRTLLGIRMAVSNHTHAKNLIRGEPLGHIFSCDIHVKYFLQQMREKYNAVLRKEDNRNERAATPMGGLAVDKKDLQVDHVS